MFGSFLKGIFTFILAFTLGVSVGRDRPADSELQQKVQDHMDVIVDESAGIVDDVVEEVRKNEHVQEAEQFLEDVEEIAGNTADDIHAHFGREEETEEDTEALTEEALEDTAGTKEANVNA